MAISKVLLSNSLSIEVETGEVDTAGDPKYAKKTFSGIKATATTQDIYDVAQSIKNVLNAGTGETLITSTSSLING